MQSLLLQSAQCEIQEHTWWVMWGQCPHTGAGGTNDLKLEPYLTLTKWLTSIKTKCWCSLNKQQNYVSWSLFSLLLIFAWSYFHWSLRSHFNSLPRSPYRRFSRLCSLHLPVIFFISCLVCALKICKMWWSSVTFASHWSKMQIICFI